MNKNTDYLETSSIIDKSRQPGWFPRLWGCLCPCLQKKREKVYLEDKSKLTTGGGSTEANEMRDIHRSLSDNIMTKRQNKLMYRSALEKVSKKNQVKDYVEGRRTIPIQLQAFPILNFRENQTLLISSHPCFKMLARVNSSRLHPSKHLIQKHLQASTTAKGLFSNPKLDAFWSKRYLLFEKFDHGIRLDQDSWAQILPEVVGEHLAMRAQSAVLLDAYAGVGSAAIKFSATCKTVLAADQNILKLECLHNNARIYSADNIVKINEDFLTLKSTKADTVFLYPECRPDYTPTTQIDPFTYFKPQLRLLIQKAVVVAPNIILLLRPNVDIEKLCQLFAQILGVTKNSLCSLELEKIFFMDKLQYIAVYYGPLVNRQFSLGDQLEEIYKLLNQNKGTTFHHVRVVKQLREKYGMALLLQLVCEATHSLKESTINLFYELIQRKKLIPQGRLENLISLQKQQPGKVINYTRLSMAQEVSDHTKSYTSTNSINSVDLMIGGEPMRETHINNVYKYDD